MLEPTADDLVPLVVGNEATANTFADLVELEGELRFHRNAHFWAGASEVDQVRAAVSAYRELVRLPWSAANDVLFSRFRGMTQTRIIDSTFHPAVPDLVVTLLADEERRPMLVRAQAAQTIYLLGGTQIRDLQQDGIKLSRQLQGAEIEITGYRGPVCVEALEILAPFIDRMPRTKVFANY